MLYLQLHDQGRLSLKQRQHVLQQGNGLAVSFQGIILQILQPQILNYGLFAADSAQIAVMDHGQMPVCHQVHVQLRPKAVLYSLAESGQGVLRDVLAHVVEAPVGIADIRQFLPAGLALPRQQHQAPEQEQRHRDEKNVN